MRAVVGGRDVSPAKWPEVAEDKVRIAVAEADSDVVVGPAVVGISAVCR